MPNGNSPDSAQSHKPMNLFLQQSCETAHSEILYARTATQGTTPWQIQAQQLSPSPALTNV